MNGLNRHTDSWPKALTGFLWGALVLLLIVLDQWTKSLAKAGLRGTEGIVLIPGVLELRYLENRGMAFGLLEGKQLFLIFLCLLFVAGLICCFLRIPKNQYYLPLILSGAVVGAGALGNGIDRIFLGYVVDFIYVSLIDFPVFNVADIFVVCGGAVLVILAGFVYQEEDFDFIRKKRK